MKACPSCFRLYPDAVTHCAEDATRLLGAASALIPAHPDDDRVGRVLLGKYRVFRVAAEGGMARVYEALDETRQRQVAVKVLHPALIQDPVSAERFQREYEVGSTLAHPNLVRVLDFGTTHDGAQVLAMEFLHGQSLRALLKHEGRLPAPLVVRLLREVALALDFVHSRDWVHRDLKPENVLLCGAVPGAWGGAKLLDLGAIKHRRGGSKSLTLLGNVVGSPFYMSPEQAQGSPNLDQRADVWSLAVIAYECLSGKLPFCGPNGPSTLLQILTQPPPPLSLWLAEADPAWTTAVDAALAGGLTKNPAERSPSAGAFVERLAAALGAGQRPAGAPRSGPQVAPPAIGNGSGTLVGLPELPSGLRAPRRAFVDRPAHVLWLAVGASFVLLVVLGLFMA